MSHPDTIVAAATPPGRGGVGVVRVSGPKTPEIAATLVGELPGARHATLLAFLDARRQSHRHRHRAVFPGPAFLYGRTRARAAGPWRAGDRRARWSSACIELGARRARPGEFTERAFHNDKIDLAQAEAVADLIDAGSREAARAAMRSLQGEFSSMVQGLTDALIDLRTYVEAAIDFPEEEVDFLGDMRARRAPGQRARPFRRGRGRRGPGPAAARRASTSCSPAGRTRANPVC